MILFERWQYEPAQLRPHARLHNTNGSAAIQKLKQFGIRATTALYAGAMANNGA